MYIIIIYIFNFSDTLPAPKSHRYNKLSKKVREQEASAIYDSSEDNEKVPKSKGGKGVKPSSKIVQKSVPTSPGNSTQNTSGLKSRNSTQKAATSAKSKPIHKPAYLVNKGPKFSTKEGSTSHYGIKPNTSKASETREDEDNNVINEDEQEDEASQSELWKEGRHNPKENILISLKKAVEQLKNKESSEDYESDNEEKKKCKRETSRKEKESDKKKKKKKKNKHQMSEDETESEEDNQKKKKKQKNMEERYEGKDKSKNERCQTQKRHHVNEDETENKKIHKRGKRRKRKK